MSGKAAVFYGRVSTGRQGRSGLGLDAQKATVAAFAAQHGFTIAEEMIEVETGKGHDAIDRRPQLRKALDAAKKLKAPSGAAAPVIVSKLCRLGRDVHFISGLMVNRVPFIVAELGPDADPFMLHIYASLAEKERNLIAARTREALKVAKARAKAAGKPWGVVAAAHKAEAEERAADLAPVIRELASAGITSVRAVAEELNRRGIETPRGGAWHPTSVARLLARLSR